MGVSPPNLSLPMPVNDLKLYFPGDNELTSCNQHHHFWVIGQLPCYICSLSYIHGRPSRNYLYGYGWVHKNQRK